MKVSIIMQPLLIFFTCLVMLCLVVYFLGHFWMTSILLDVNMYCRFFAIFELLNCVINNPLVLKIKVWRKEKFFHVSHMRVGLIPCLVFFKRKQNRWRFCIRDEKWIIIKNNIFILTVVPQRTKYSRYWITCRVITRMSLTNWWKTLTRTS